MVYLVGDNRAAARAAALPLGRVGAGVFAIAGACAGLAGIFMASFNHSASLLLNRGTPGYDAIAAVLIGGAAIGGLSVDPTVYTNVPGGDVHWTFTNGNYNDQAGDAPVTITQAASTGTVTFETAPYVYRNPAFTARAEGTGGGSSSPRR